MLRKEIRIRDPFILTDKQNKCYYMYGTTDLKNGYDAGNKFYVYKTYDLENYEQPKLIFYKENYWAHYDFWASEVHEYNKKYYLFGSGKAQNHCRGTFIAVSDTPDGMFEPLTNQPITPPLWECLDGTLYVENDIPYIVFCKEWLQTEIGEVYAMRLSQDLTKAVSEPKLLFKANFDSFVGGFTHDKKTNCMVTDGTYIIKNKNMLNMIWSSNSIHGKYCLLCACANSIMGEWHALEPVFHDNGGHGMVFKDLQNNLRLTLHFPNTPPSERPTFFDVYFDNNQLKIKN